MPRSFPRVPLSSKNARTGRVPAAGSAALARAALRSRSQHRKRRSARCGRCASTTGVRRRTKSGKPFSISAGLRNPSPDRPAFRRAFACGNASRSRSRRNFVMRVSLALIASVLFTLIASASAPAHEGHDHGEAPKTLAPVAARGSAGRRFRDRRHSSRRRSRHLSRPVRDQRAGPERGDRSADTERHGTSSYERGRDLSPSGKMGGRPRSLRSDLHGDGRRGQRSAAGDDRSPGEPERGAGCRKGFAPVGGRNRVLCRGAGVFRRRVCGSPFPAACEGEGNRGRRFGARLSVHACGVARGRQKRRQTTRCRSWRP